jgi:predicted dehydrogenase
MIKVAVVGCGKIADSHASQILRIPGCEIVGVCDTDELMAQQLFERFPIQGWYTDVDTLFRKARPDVVHITTPPQSHFPIGMKCIELGAHILVEKPFTVTTSEARTLISFAEKEGKKVTAGHDAQFSPVARHMRTLVREGYLGGTPVHMESHWCYDLSDTTYAKALLADKYHWARRLPGGLPHNIISHGVSKIAEYLRGNSAEVIAHGFVSPFLRELGETKMIDEVRAIVHDENDTTAYFTFSSQMRPSLHQFSIYGPRNGILIDEDKRILLRLAGTGFKSFAEHFVQPALFAKQHLGNARRNMSLFMANKFHMDDGKMRLFKSFYRSIAEDMPVPIPYREIILTSLIMDSIFAQVGDKSARG